ncbi:MAG: hypothetical protein OMM_06621 [Candidatus Magnetoglobus multicellularis str. Araruama]|uniref:Uncharacterized protein n=1 Tax=Candidatus Magnetoglobus multicellularis str. Araruama TaxID=890399 RepID=A0A1V1PGD6_9BACT|nr:MAG: hypothetical protein OMM_06621 [Candidatus Magnetoglobus multicellularis str. Araruama]
MKKLLPIYIQPSRIVEQIDIKTGDDETTLDYFFTQNAVKVYVFETDVHKTYESAIEALETEICYLNVKLREFKLLAEEELDENV